MSFDMFYQLSKIITNKKVHNRAVVHIRIMACFLQFDLLVVLYLHPVFAVFVIHSVCHTA